MELRILSPMEDGKRKLNGTMMRLKEAISAKVQDYKGLQYTRRPLKRRRRIRQP